MYVCCVYLLCIYKYTHMHVYKLNVFIYNMNYIHINIDMLPKCKYFQIVYCIYVHLYT